MRSILVVAVLCAGSWAAAETPSSQPVKESGKDRVVIERVLAVVNDTVILESELTQRVGAFAATELQDITDVRERSQKWRTLVRNELDRMIDDELMVQAAAEANLEVTPDEVDKAIAEVKKQNKLTDTQFDQALTSQGLTMAQYRKDVRRQILQLRAMNVLIRPRVSVSDEDVREHYNKMASRSSAVTEVRLAHILLLLPERPEAGDMDAARRRAGELVERARAGEDFGELAGSTSDDAGSKAQGGDLGWFKRGELPTEWEEIVFAMEKGDVRGPVRGEKGMHVFRVTDVKKEEIKPFEEMKEPLRQKLTNEELEKQTRVWLEERRKKAFVEVKQ